MRTIPKLIRGGQILLACILTGCAGSTANNKGLDYDQLDVVFEASMPDGTELVDGALFGVAGTCSRNGEQNVPMSNNGISAYRPTQAQTHLVKNSDEDALVSYKSDAGYQFYAFYPYDSAVTDLSAINADVPSEITLGHIPSPLYVSSTSKSSVVAPIKLDFKRMTCTMSFRFADDIVSSESGALKSILLRPANAENLSGALAYNATYNLYAGELNIDQQSAKKEITFNFGESGISLEGYTDVACELAPFNVPEGGFELVFTDVNGNSNTVTIMDGEVSKTYKAGDFISMVVTPAGTVGEDSGQSARWPIGFFDGVGGSNPRNDVRPFCWTV